MGKFTFISLALLSLQTLFVNAQDAPEGGEEASNAPTLDVTASTSFPASEIFGVKVVNGHPTEALVSFNNEDSDPVLVNLIGGSLWTLDTPDEPGQLVRNLTTARYNLQVPAGEKESLTYTFSTEMHPQDLRLHLAAAVSNSAGTLYTLSAFNETVSVVEPDTSIFDPQIIFLYFVILACFGGVLYSSYTMWIAPYFPQKRKGGAEKVKKAKPEPAEQTADGDSTSGKTFDTEWIPAHHLNRPEARKVKGTGPRPKKG